MGDELLSYPDARIPIVADTDEAATALAGPANLTPVIRGIAYPAVRAYFQPTGQDMQLTLRWAQQGKPRVPVVGVFEPSSFRWDVRAGDTACGLFVCRVPDLQLSLNKIAGGGATVRYAVHGHDSVRDYSLPAGDGILASYDAAIAGGGVVTLDLPPYFGPAVLHLRSGVAYTLSVQTRSFSGANGNLLTWTSAVGTVVHERIALPSRINRVQVTNSSAGAAAFVVSVVRSPE
jgi:hypothetical protein